MGIENSPRSYEQEPLVDAVARHELMVDLMQTTAELIKANTAEKIKTNPELHAMLSKLIEGGLELQPHLRDHLKRMVALRIGSDTQAAIQADSDSVLYRMAADELRYELEELSRLDLDDLPDLWDIAYEDLLNLEGGVE